MAGQQIPCGYMRARGGAYRTCDAHGFQLGLATLPGSTHTECHDEIGSELFDILQEARLHVELQPSHIFSALVPVATLLARGRPHSIIPDALIHVSLPAVATRRGTRRGPALPARALLFDVKTIHAGTAHYHSPIAEQEQSGAVRHREATVRAHYLAHARELDRLHSAPGTTPVEDRLRWFTDTRGLIFGAYGEASADVHDLLTEASVQEAQRLWRLMGARSMSEMRGFVISRMRRRVGVAAVRAMAQHRLLRVPFVGASHAAVAARGTARQQGGGRGSPVEAEWFAHDFFAHGGRVGEDERR